MFLSKTNGDLRWTPRLRPSPATPRRRSRPVRRAVDGGARLRQPGELAPDAEIYFERIAVTEEQIVDWNLPTRPTKVSDTRAKNFGDVSVELDAIAPNDLRALVEQVINRHLPQDQLRILQEAERSERELLTTFACQAGGAP